jgi:DNA-binding transcriptional LysR family regulator
MKFSFFETLGAVLQTGSLARAAVKMNITPSAVSMQMKQVEAYFGQPLFDRSGLQVRPTPFALEVAAVMHQPMMHIEELRRINSIQIQGLLRLGVIETMQASLLPGIVRQIKAQHPALQLKPTRGRAVELIAAVKSNLLDSAIVVQPAKGGSQRLHWQSLFNTELVVIAPVKSKHSQLKNLFLEFPWIRFDTATGTGRLAAQWAAKHVPHAKVSMDLQSVHAVLAMVSAGLGVSVIPRPDDRMSIAYPVKIYELGAQAPSLRISLVSRKTDATSRSVQALLEAIESVIQNDRLGFHK